MKKKTELLMGVLMLMLIAAIVSRLQPVESNNTQIGSNKKYTVVIDAGHGGNDPGKVGVNQALEKDINLAIALQLKNFLEFSDVNVILTREKDEGLYKASDKNKKMADMKARCSIIEAAQPDLVISIHQNSFPQESVKGAQVFYYKNSEKGKELAQMIQERFGQMSSTGKNREVKANDNYYLLLNVTPPIVIVECGFLSNPEEAAQLVDKEYQEKIAWTIHMSVMSYLNQQ